MFVVTLSLILSITIAYFSSYNGKVSRQLFQLSFVPITFLQMIYYNYGADYMGYLNDHLAYYSKSFEELLYYQQMGSGAFKDIGWALLGFLFQGKIGFFGLVAILSLIRNIVYYELIKKYVHPKLRWEALTIYLFTVSYYLLGFSALRQGIAVAVCVYAMMLALENQLIKAIISVILVSTIHASALIILPFLFFNKLKIENGKKYVIIIMSTALILFLSPFVVTSIFMNTMHYFTFFAMRYAHQAFDMPPTKTSVGVGFALNMVMYLVMLYFMWAKFKEIPKEYRIFMIFTCIGIMVVPFQFNVSGLASRVGSYFSVFQIVAVPTIYSKIRHLYFRLTVAFVYIFMLFYNYYLFLCVTEWSAKSYHDFDTIFSVLL